MAEPARSASRRVRWRQRLIGGALILAGAAYLSPSLGLAPPVLLVNTGTSLPPGRYLYQRADPVAVGDVVALRYPRHFHLPWLLKRVAGVGGASFCWRPELGTHTLDGRTMPPPLPEAIARGIPVWHGCRRLAGNEVVGYGESADSYDSRYLGPVTTDRLWGVYRHVEQAGSAREVGGILRNSR